MTNEEISALAAWALPVWPHLQGACEAAIKKALAAERERCAKIADDWNKMTTDEYEKKYGLTDTGTPADAIRKS